MSKSAFWTNIGDITEGVLKWFHIGDQRSADIGNAVAAVLGDFMSKWKPHEMQVLLADAAIFAPGVIADPSSFLTAAGALFQKALNDSLNVTLTDARDALRVHVLAAPATADPSRV